MNKTEMVKDIEMRMSEVKHVIACLNNGTTPEGKSLSDNTCNTQRHVRTRELRLLNLLKDVVDACDKESITISKESSIGYQQLCYPNSITKGITVTIGDSVMSLLQTYSTTKDVYAKIMKAVSDSGLRIVDGIVVR